MLSVLEMEQLRKSILTLFLYRMAIKFKIIMEWRMGE